MSFTTQCVQTVAQQQPASLENVFPKQLHSVPKLPIYGLPPQMYDKEPQQVVNRFRIIRITPGRMKMFANAWSYIFEPDYDTFNKRLAGLLANVGIEAPSFSDSNPIQFVVDAEDVEFTHSNSFEENVFARTAVSYTHLTLPTSNLV